MRASHRQRTPKRKAASSLNHRRDPGPKLFGSLFVGPTWQGWRAVLRALFGLPMDEVESALFRQLTGRTVAPTTQAREAYLIIGRRDGKSRIAALVAVFLACFRSYKHVLSAGERGVIMLIASDRKQARVLKRYVSGFLNAVPMLAAMIVNETAESIELNNSIIIEIHTASFRAVRGYTLVGVVLDELAFWPVDDSASPDSEIINALRPAMATVPNALMLAISSPYARRGELYKAYKEHFGKDDDPVLVIQGASRLLNPLIPRIIVDNAYAADPMAASAEYGAEFRRDVEAFVSIEAVEAVTIPGRLELPHVAGLRYFGFVDPSGGSQDAMTLAVAHREQDRMILDLIREVVLPFSPEAVAKEFAETLKGYNVTKVVGDRYGGEWPREQFRKHGVEYQVSERVKSDIYRECLPLPTSRCIELLDHARLTTQLQTLERRTGRGGKDSIDHAPQSHDDVANSCFGALLLCGSGPASMSLDQIGVMFDANAGLHRAWDDRWDRFS